MFDPSVSDPLVLEHGADDYHVAAPLDSIMQITIYEDIAAKCFSWSVRLSLALIVHYNLLCMFVLAHILFLCFMHYSV